MTNLWSKSTTPASNNAATPNGFPEGWEPSSVNDAMRQFAAEVLGAIITLAGGGTADAITAVAAPVTASLVDKMVVKVRATAPNATTTPTFQLDSLGTAGTIEKYGGVALAVGDINAAGHVLFLQYVSSDNHWELLNPFPAVTTTASLSGTIDGGTF